MSNAVSSLGEVLSDKNLIIMTLWPFRGVVVVNVVIQEGQKDKKKV